MSVMIDLPGDRRVEVEMRVNCGPAFPTPHEPDEIRVPTVAEFVETVKRLAMVRIDQIIINEEP